jgi:L-alanine-DL-glutamate epimerase-like enolase superfamily enzyme
MVAEPWVPPGSGSRPESGFAGPAFDEEQYLEAIPDLMEHLRVKLDKDVKLILDVHEHLTPTGAVEFARRDRFRALPYPHRERDWKVFAGRSAPGFCWPVL